MPELDNMTIAALDELDVRSKVKDPNYVTKQLLKGNTCDTCWRLSMIEPDNYYCGSPQPNEPIRIEQNAHWITPLPKVGTCEFYVPRYRQRDDEKST